MIPRYILYALVGFGVWNGGSLSYHQSLSGEACPILGAIPACYIAFAGYLAMAIALVLDAVNARGSLTIFWSGLAIAGGLALLGSAFEIWKGDVCPRAFGWVPMCYISLFFSILIGGLYTIAINDRDNPVQKVDKSN